MSAFCASAISVLICSIATCIFSISILVLVNGVERAIFFSNTFSIASVADVVIFTASPEVSVVAVDFGSVTSLANTLEGSSVALAYPLIGAKMWDFKSGISVLALLPNTPMMTGTC